jgi:hypothetical protein
VQLLDTPGGLAHFPGLAAAVAQGLLPLAAHLTLCALREARRRQGGKCKPRRQCSCRQSSGAGQNGAAV